MNEYYVFNKTVRGYLHILKERNCEDSSSSYISDEKKYSIAVVADGHGSKSCFRSETGSRFAVEVTLDALKIFCDYYLVKDENGEYTESEEFIALLKNERTKKQTIKQLTDSIISEWNMQIIEDLKKNPVTQEEIKNSDPKYTELYHKGSELNHIYGTTLIAAVMLKNYIILFQQGDGRCDVFYDDGSVEQPIPWDERCYNVYTTSMSDDDVDTSIRSAVIDLNKKNVAACYIGCDGVEDSYRTMDGTHVFYMELSNMLTEDPENFLTYLDEYLPVFSKAGSGDDISVSGIVNTASIKKLYDKYKYNSEIYHLEEKKIQIKNKLNSMSRKHQHLKTKTEKLKTGIISVSEHLAKGIIYPETLFKNKDMLDNNEKEIILQYKADSDSFSQNIKKEFPLAYDIFEDALNKNYSDTDFNKALKNLSNLESEDYQIKLKDASEKINSCCKEYASCNNEFEKYNNKYKKLISDLKQTDLKIKKLG